MGLGWDFAQAGGSIVPGGSYLIEGIPCKVLTLEGMIRYNGMHCHNQDIKLIRAS